jgi:hypothetical protein
VIGVNDHPDHPRIAAQRLRARLPQIVDGLPEAITAAARRAEAGEAPGTRQLETAMAEISRELRTTRRAMHWALVGSGLVVLAAVALVYPPLPGWFSGLAGVAGLVGWVKAWRIAHRG